MSARDLLLPRTDAGAIAQAIAVAAVFMALLWLVRRSREARIIVVAFATLTFAFFALRTVH